MSGRDLSRFWEWGRKIVCVGRNYADHAAELQNAVPREPVLFLKPPSAYLRPGSAVRIPRYSRGLQHEVELGLVIGRGGSDIPQASAMEHVAGFAVCLDMTARDVQNELKAQGLPWTLAKAFDSSCPVSDFIPKEKLPEPEKARIWLKVNGELKQSGCPSQMLFSMPFLVSYISGIMTLEEGDLILTGTPAGVSFVRDQDELTAGIDRLLSVSFRVEQRS